MLEAEEYEALRTEPDTHPVMYQRWRSLLFMHFPCDPSEIQALLPPGLTVDTFPDSAGVEKAWVGLVPFRMEGIRRAGLIPIPGASAFPETNVRTYVHRDGHQPGVWFFSLDAGSTLACTAARLSFKLPYHHAKMKVVEGEGSVTYESKRGDDGRYCNVACNVVSPRPLPRIGTLDFFLIERYALYAIRDGHPVVGRVRHRPYTLYSVRIDSLEENLVEAAGIASRPFEHLLFSYGVDVQVHALGR